MESSSGRIERSLIRIVLILAGVIVLLSVGVYFGVRTFHAWQERRLLAEANALVNKGDFNRASFDAKRILEFDNQSAGANRVLADVAERNGLGAALELRRRTAELSGNSSRDLLAWTRSALRFGDPTVAAKALDVLPAAERNTAEYHALRAAVALLLRDAGLYEKELSRALRHRPSAKLRCCHS